MGKSVIFLFGLLITFFIDIFTVNEANIYAKFPSEVEAGKEFEIEITIEKGNLNEFGRFTQTLPAGFTATSDNRLFSFDNNQVKVLWINLPVGNVFSFTYKIQVPIDYTGNFELGGQFAYVMDNERKFVELTPNKVIAKPSGANINAKDVIAGTGNDIIPQQNNLSCTRQFVENGNETIINLKLKKDQLNNMAKIVEKIPTGFTATSIETNTGIFSFTDQTVKFLWMNIPNEEEFIVSYKLTPTKNQKLDKNQFAGEFSYSVNNLTYSIKIENEKIEKEHIVNNLAQNNIEANTQKEVIKDFFEPQKHLANVNFKIQIAAGHRLVNVKTYFKKFDLNEQVTVIQHEGWHKYIIKNFNTYQEARDYRNIVWESTPIKDAFVTAYNNNDRITVQEALMISNQKWFK